MFGTNNGDEDHVNAAASATPAPTRWQEPTAALRGSIVVLAGRGESAAVYRRFATRLAFDGYRVAIVPDAALAPAEAAAEAAELLAERDEVPRILVGSDSGASVLVSALAGGRVFADVAVLAGLPVAGVAGLAGGGGGAVDALDWEQELALRSACPVHRTALEGEGALEAGALARTDAVVETVDARLAAGVLIPVLAVHGDADAVSPAERAVAVYGALPEVESVLVAGGRHDVLNDVTHRSVAATIVLFLERLRTPGRGRVVVPAAEALTLAP
jgi:alpha-beta hydrolase superfamily lysophospholipase